MASLHSYVLRLARQAKEASRIAAGLRGPEKNRILSEVVRLLGKE